MSNQEIDKLVYQAVFAESDADKKKFRDLIWQAAQDNGIYSASIQNLYEAVGKGEISGFTVPAINVRAIAYDMARAIFATALENNVGAFVLELARSEMGYTFQRPGEFASVMMAAAIREGFKGPVFIQGDHYQINAKKFADNNEREKELQELKDLIKEAVQAGYRNIDIDASTIVDLSKSTIEEQQRDNFTMSADLTAYTRSLQPADVTIAIGGEIGEVGKKNSTPEEFRAYMKGYFEELNKIAPGAKGPTKAAVQTGTSHGGIPLPDGTVAQVSIDFGVLKEISQIARTEFGMAGAVQHGASTLPAEAFDEFLKAGAAEVHLATEFQNIIIDHPAFPQDLKQEMYEWLKLNCADERKPDMTDQQFYYKTRKKIWGPFKQKTWDLLESIKSDLRVALSSKFELLFSKLGVVNSSDTVKKYT